MDREERKIKELMSPVKSIAGKCPDLSELSALVDGTLEPEAEEKIREHLANCANCLEMMRINLELEEEVPGSVPERLAVRAKSLFRPNFIRQAINVFGGILKGRAETLEPSSLRPAFAFRGAIPAKAALGLSGYFQEFGPYRAEIEVEQTSENKWQVLVWGEDKASKKPARGIRVSINNKERELESLILEKGRAVFELLPAGEYQVEFWKQGKKLAGIIIRMKGEGK